MTPIDLAADVMGPGSAQVDGKNSLLCFVSTECFTVSWCFFFVHCCNSCAFPELAHFMSIAQKLQYP